MTATAHVPPSGSCSCAGAAAGAGAVAGGAGSCAGARTAIDSAIEASSPRPTADRRVAIVHSSDVSDEIMCVSSLDRKADQRDRGPANDDRAVEPL